MAQGKGPKGLKGPEGRKGSCAAIAQGKDPKGPKRPEGRKGGCAVALLVVLLLVLPASLPFRPFGPFWAQRKKLRGKK